MFPFKKFLEAWRTRRKGPPDRLKLARSSKREESRVYRCPMCFGWHLTSQPWRKRVERKGS